MKKKLLLLALSLAVVFSTIVGCTTRKENPTKSPSSTSFKQTLSTTSQEESSVSVVPSQSVITSSSTNPTTTNPSSESLESTLSFSSNSSTPTSSSPNVSVVTTYGVTFSADGAINVPTMDNQQVGAKFNIPTQIPSKTNCIFEGWSYNGNTYNVGDEFTMPASNVEFVAIWSQTYSVIFNGNGNTSGNVPTIENQKAGAKVTIPSCNIAKADCVFEGWSYSGKTYKVGEALTMPSSNVEFVAVWSQTYAVMFNANGATGTVPTISNKKAGETFSLPSTTLYKEWHEFGGWECGDKVYAIGDTFTMPAYPVEFVAVWNSTIPGEVKFSQSTYYYNRLGGNDLELPIELNGATVHYVKVNDEYIDNSYFTYSSARKTLILKEEYVLSLTDGEYIIKPITDSGLYNPTSCVLVTRNSINTELLSSNITNVVYGKQTSAVFNFNFNGTNVTSVKVGSTKVDSKYYWKSGNNLHISSELISKYLGEVNFSVRLSNNDVYKLTTYSNMAFTTDYDATTIHSTVASNIGHNPLYQYYDNVSIVNAPTQYGFESGRALKITPSTVNGITYDCYGYFTLRGPSCPYMWYNVGYTSGKYYAISFDYATEGTTRGDLVFRTENSSWSQNLLLGPSNDGKVHHFSTILSGDTIAYGTILWAKFVGGGGCVYIDNFKVAELDSAPSLTKTGDYASGSGAYSFTLNPNGFAYNIYIDETKVTNATISGTTVTIPASVMQELVIGYHTLSVKYGPFDQSFNFLITTQGTVTLSTHDIGVTYGGGAVTISATVTPGTHIVSAKRTGSNHWDNTVTNPVKEGQLTNYSPNNGYLDISYFGLESYCLTLKSELVDILYGTEQIAIEFSNGQTEVINVTSNLLFFSNYDDAYIHEEYGGNVSYCQDTAMSSFIQVDGNTKIKYEPSKATLGHAKDPNGDDNGIMTFANTYLNTQGWWPHNIGISGKVIVFFDYEVVTTSGSGNFKFNYLTGGSGFSGVTKHDVDITGSGHFSIELDAKDLNSFRIYAPMTTGVNDNAGSYMIIDNFGFGVIDEYKTKVSGTFNTALSIKSVKKTGIADWDDTYDNADTQDNYSEANGYVSPSLIKVTSNALLISDKLFKECYVGTNAGVTQGSKFLVTFSDNSTTEFILDKSYGVTNMFYSNFDTTNIYQESNYGNVESCQDTAMRSRTNDSLYGGTAIVYTPSNATLGHATNGSYDNGIMTITNSRINSSGWWQHDFGTSGTAYVSFNYTITVGQGKTNNFKFTWLKGGSGWSNYSRQEHALSATSGYFYLEMPVSQLNAFYIHCLGVPTDNTGSYMTIDNYCFGVK